LSKVKIGIDPGLSGAIAVVCDDYIGLHDMPLMACPWSPKKKMVDGLKLMDILRTQLGAKVTIEIVHSMPKQGVASTFTFGQSFGVVVGIVQAMGFKLNMVTPQKWKGKCGLIGMDKDASRQMALRMYPDMAEQLKFKKHHDRADALFIAVS